MNPMMWADGEALSPRAAMWADGEALSPRAVASFLSHYPDQLLPLLGNILEVDDDDINDALPLLLPPLDDPSSPTIINLDDDDDDDFVPQQLPNYMMMGDPFQYNNYMHSQTNHCSYLNYNNPSEDVPSTSTNIPITPTFYADTTLLHQPHHPSTSRFKFKEPLTKHQDQYPTKPNNILRSAQHVSRAPMKEIRENTDSVHSKRKARKQANIRSARRSEERKKALLNWHQAEIPRLVDENATLSAIIGQKKIACQFEAEKQSRLKYELQILEEELKHLEALEETKPYYEDMLGKQARIHDDIDRLLYQKLRAPPSLPPVNHACTTSPLRYNCSSRKASYY